MTAVGDKYIDLGPQVIYTFQVAVCIPLIAILIKPIKAIIGMFPTFGMILDPIIVVNRL